MKAIFIGTSKHYTTGKEYNIKSKLCQVLSHNTTGINNIIAVYNMDDEAAVYRFTRSRLVDIERDEDHDIIRTSSSQPCRAYETIEEFLKDWQVIENE